MSTFPIKWHEECLTNFVASRDFLQREVDRKTAELARMNQEISFRRMQIETAKAKGKPEFDGDRFMGGFQKWQEKERQAGIAKT
jgi:hypothetical protein